MHKQSCVYTHTQTDDIQYLAMVPHLSCIVISSKLNKLRPPSLCGYSYVFLSSGFVITNNREVHCETCEEWLLSKED